MKTYKIEVTETLRKVVEIEAESLSEAIVIAGSNYECGVISLDTTDDFVGYGIKEYTE